MECAMALHRRDDLATVPLFRHLSRRRRRALSRGAVRLELPAGDVLFDEGSEGHEFVAVLSGEVEVTRVGHEVAVLGEGEYLGEAALTTRTHRNATAIARTDATIVCIGPADFDAVRARSAEIDAELRATAARRQAGS
jgi:CRP-like cAMP-binding protein